MTVRELIQKIEAERDALKKENKNLKSTIDKLTKEKKLVENELKSLKDLLFESEQKEKEPVKIQEEVKEEPKVEEVESQLTSIVANVDGKTYADVVKGGSVSIDDVVTEEPKPRRSRRKKTEETPIFVEPVEETENV